MTDDRLTDLATRHYHGELTAAEAGELSAALRDSARAREVFTQVSVLVVGLAAHFPPATRSAPVRRRRAGVAWAVGLAAALLVAGGWLLVPGTAPAVPFLAEMEANAGEVRVGEEGAVLGARVRAGESVRTVGLGSSATLRFPDGTRVFLAGNTAVTVDPAGRPRVEMARGDIAAEVPTRPAGDPVRIATREGEVRASGTQVLVTRAEGRTRVGVVEGQATLADTGEGRVEMGAGDHAEACDGQVRMLPRPVVPDTCAVVFDPARPAEWEVGRAADDHLPPGSPGAVRMVPVPRPGKPPLHEVRLVKRWTDGMFAVHPDTWVSVRFRADRPGFHHLLVVARSHDPRHKSGVVYEAPVWRGREAGRWHTAHVRLADCRKLEDPDVPRPLVGFLVVASSDRDVGVTVDRFWVSRGAEPAPFPE
ncbi:MAG: hypothetical protein C0501_13360 [Isosphaera sp.]|nr:hypothetical protein [Isosphaera sp.]